jgi:hypothetical protein
VIRNGSGWIERGGSVKYGGMRKAECYQLIPLVVGVMYLTIADTNWSSSKTVFDDMRRLND